MKREKLEARGGVVIPAQASQHKTWPSNPSPILSRLQRIFIAVDALPFGYLLMAVVLLVIGVEVML